MDNNISCGIHNKFDIEVIRDGEIRQKAQAFNIVTNKLWDYLIGSNDAFGKYIQYGSGSGTPSANDTSLFAKEGSASVTEVSLDVDHANSVITRVCKITLGLSTAVGVTLTEVGIAGGQYDGNLTTHAMLQDMNGNPITIAKTDTDIINIYATIYCHWSVDGDNVTFHPVDALTATGGYVKRSYNMLKTLTGIYNRFNAFNVGVAMGNCIVSSSKGWTKNGNVSQKKITFTPARYTESEGNIGGISHLVSTDSMVGLAIRCGEKAWSKYHITGEAVGTGDGETTGFKTKIGLPENAVVKINGNAVSGVTVKKIPVDRVRLMRIDPDLSTDGHLVYAEYVPQFMGTMVFYNPDYADVTIDEFNTYSYYSTSDVDVYVSNDLVTWTSVGHWSGSSGNIHATIPADYKHYKYFKIVLASSANDSNSVGSTCADNIIFNTAPAVGDVITIDYDTECIPKDADHVFDATVTFTFGEYSD
jgi:hypothetical protein